MRIGVLLGVLACSMLAGCGGSSGSAGTKTYVDCGTGTGSSAPPGLTCYRYVDCVTTSLTIQEGTRCKATNTTTQPANVPPVIALSVTAGGIVLPANTTTVGQNVTFDASRTTDDDGDGLLLVAVGASDANRTYAPQLLFSAGDFRQASFAFDRAGPVNVRVQADDRRGGQSFLRTVLFVDQRLPLSEDFTLAGPPAPAGDASTCSGPTGQGSIDPAMWKPAAIAVAATTTYVVARVTGGMASIALCDPSGHAISPSSTDTVTSDPGTIFVGPQPGLASYYVSILSGAAAQTATVDVFVHYEPR